MFRAARPGQLLGHQDAHAHQGPDDVNRQGHHAHEHDRGRDSVEDELTGGELLGVVGDGVGGRAHQEQEGHARRDQGGEQDDLSGDAQIGGR